MEPLPDCLPLVIGVTGHRDLRDQDIPRLEREVAGVLASLRRDFLGKEDETPANAPYSAVDEQGPRRR